MFARRRISAAASGCLFFLALAQAAEAQSFRPHGARDAEFLRWQWFYEQRAFPRSTIPKGAYLNSLRQLDSMWAKMSAKSPAATLKWQLVGPRPLDCSLCGSGPFSGRVTALVVDPLDSSTVYLGAAEGGVWKTSDAGKKWTPLTDRQPSLATGSIAVDPLNHLNVYVGTGEDNFNGDSYYGEGILKSTDGGATWKQLCGTFCGTQTTNGGARIGGLAVDPNNSNVILAAVDWGYSGGNGDGVYRSTDGGRKWTNVLQPAYVLNTPTAVLFDPSNGNVAYAAIEPVEAKGPTGVWKSTDGGTTWSADNGSGSDVLPLSSTGRIALAIAASSTKTLYAALATPGGDLLGVFKTTDGGGHWTQLTNTPDFCAYPQCWYDLAIAVDPINPSIVFAGGSESTTLFRSLDGGGSWTQMGTQPGSAHIHADLHALAFSADGGSFYVGSDGGTWSTQDISGSAKFSNLNNTLAITQFYPGLAMNPATASGIGGTQDNGSDLYSGKKAWDEVICGDGGNAAIDNLNSNIVYGACSGEIAILKSTSGGGPGTWKNADTGINPSDHSLWVPPLSIDPGNTPVLYYGTSHIWQTTDGAESWNSIFMLPNQQLASAISVAPSNGNTVIATGDGPYVYVTTDAQDGGNSHWTDISNGLPFRSATAVAIHPTNPSNAYLTFSGFRYQQSAPGNVFETTNLGSSWIDVSGNLPNTPVSAVLINPLKPNQIFVGTDVGVFYSDDSATWSPLGKGLPRVAVMSLSFQSQSQTLTAATHGRSAWSINVSTLP